MTKQMLITLALILVAVIVVTSELQQNRFGSALIAVAVAWGLMAVFFRQHTVFARRAVRVTK